MKNTTMNAGSPHKSKWIWLLWFAPLMVPLSWLGFEYFRVVNVTYSVAPLYSQPAKPYGILATAIRDHPFANEFQINWLHSYTLINLIYNRHNRSLIQVFGGSSGGSRYQELWNGVTDSIIHTIARTEARSTTPISSAYVQFIGSELKLRGAHQRGFIE